MSLTYIEPDRLVKYTDVYTDEALEALEALSSLNAKQKELMRSRNERRKKRIAEGGRIQFMDPCMSIGTSGLTVKDARDGNFTGSIIPHDLQRQWIQGTGPAAKPDSPVASSIRNVAYALLSGADGWMFDGEDALGQIKTMSLDNQRNL